MLIKNLNELKKVGKVANGDTLVFGKFKYTVRDDYLDNNYGTNDMIFDEYGIKDKYDFCSKSYGYTSEEGAFPECNFGDFDALYRVSYDIYRLILKEEIMDKKITIGGFNCTYGVYDGVFTVAYKGYRYTSSYVGDVEEAIKRKSADIIDIFSLKIEEECKGILKRFSENFDVLVSELKAINLPNTKELVLARTMQTLKENVAKVADLFADKTLVNLIRNLFK